ncbi:MAG: lipoyl domain-containing protein [Chloroflexi bacterium]|nr:lipoyl domain-containing protein [Chloroflexota bacterium]
MTTDVFIPKMTDFMEEGTIVSWLVAEGAHVEEGQAILELETDKATVEMEAPASGYLKGIRAGAVAGAAIPVGETIAFIVEAPDDVVETLPPL